MSENTNNQNRHSGKEGEGQSEDFFETAKKLADKAESFANETASKVRQSEAFSKLADALRQASDYMDEKSEEFNKSEFADKLEILKEKVIRSTDKYISRAKEASKDMAHDIEEAFESIKEKRKKKDQ
jgi:hypothetical protein